MKVILPVMDGAKSKYELAAGFDDTEFVCIYDTETSQYEWMPLSEICAKIGNLSFALKRKGVFCIITNELPLLALGLFTESGLKVYKAKGVSLQENIELFNSGSLKKYSAIDTIEMAGCSSSCSSRN